MVLNPGVLNGRIYGRLFKGIPKSLSDFSIGFMSQKVQSSDERPCLKHVQKKHVQKKLVQKCFGLFIL
jgi:hypothetical protein